MKKILILTVAMLFVASIAFGASIKGSAHDISTRVASPTGGYDEICVYCHTPHNAETTSSNLPLWNRSLNTNTSYSPYTSSTMNNTMTSDIGPQSDACMTCHDGVLSVNALKNVPNYGTAGSANGNLTGNPPKLTAGDGALSTDLSNDHPVGITFSNTDDSGLYNVTVVRGNTGVRLFGATAATATQVECASCHNVHDPGTTADGTAPFLRSTNAASVMCLICHNK